MLARDFNRTSTGGWAFWYSTITCILASFSRSYFNFMTKPTFELICSWDFYLCFKYISIQNVPAVYCSFVKNVLVLFYNYCLVTLWTVHFLTVINLLDWNGNCEVLIEQCWCRDWKNSQYFFYLDNYLTNFRKTI